MTRSEEFQQVDQLIKKGQFKEALDGLGKLEKEGVLAPIDQLRILLSKSMILRNQGRYEEALKLAEEAIKESQRLDKQLHIVDALIVQEEVLWKLGRLNESFEVIERGLQELTKITTDQNAVTQREALLIRHKGNIYYLKGYVNQAMEYHHQSLTMFEEIDDKQEIGYTLNNLGRGTALKGDLNLALEYAQKSLKIAEEFGNKSDIAYCLGNIGYIHYFKGDLDQSIEYAKQLIKRLEEAGSKQDYAYSIGIFHLILSNIERGNRDQAHHYLQRLQQINEHETNKIITQICKLAEALILKASARMSEKAKALEMLQQLVKDDIVFLDTTLTAMLNLCELLIAELKFYGEKEVLQQIKGLLTQIYDIAFNQHLSPLMVESLILRAKFSLVEGDAQGADQLLEQAKINAEERGLDQLQLKITNEQEKLQNELHKWSELSEKNAPLKERLEQAQIEAYLKEAQKIARLSGRSSL